ncbi:MAG: GNAT family N-acetyltransferase [Oscillospiraceae bacterium]|nr:GNAT family N-acetyltransferase [Oscillospiraceae bacterium]
MIQKATISDLPVLAHLAALLWPHHTAEQMKKDVADILPQEDAAFFLARDGENAIGFAQCQLRHDYVEGTGSSPVGYLEGIYVAEGSRMQGIAKALLAACEAWAREKGCREFASDCELTNLQSLQFHRNVGFEEANRIICFTKKL